MFHCVSVSNHVCVTVIFTNWENNASEHRIADLLTIDRTHVHHTHHTYVDEVNTDYKIVLDSIRNI